MPAKEDRKEVWRNIIRLIQPYKKGLLTVFIISLLSTGVTLIEPLIYREAVNDISGLFVQRARNDVKREMGVAPETDDDPITKFVEKDEAKYNAAVVIDSTKKATHAKESVRKHRVKEPHTKTHVAPRTPGEAFHTLVWATIWLFAINIIGLIFWRIGENIDIKLICTIEQQFIKKTFGHVLRLPLAFFLQTIYSSFTYTDRSKRRSFRNDWCFYQTNIA